MEYIIAIIVSLAFLIILKFAWNIKINDIKKLKEIGFNKELNEITNKLPENRKICETVLKKLNNENVIIKESDNESSFYFVLTNSILIANIKNTFSRVQTICHECLHSIQSKRTLLFNFFFSNIYLIYFLVICILTILKLNFYPMLHLFILTTLGFIYYSVRSSLEMDAMTKAKPLAKEYLQEEGTLNKEEQELILKNCEEINKIGIPLTNYKLAFNCIWKIIVYCLVVLGTGPIAYF